MRKTVKSVNIKSLIICLILLTSVCVIEVICAYAFGDGFTLKTQSGGKSSKTEAVDVIAEYQALNIQLDEHAVAGMINPKDKTGEKKPEGKVVYKINNTPEFKKGDGLGNLMIENHGDNRYLIKVKIDLDDGRTVYESDFIGPDMHIPKAPLDIVLEKGDYHAKATISAYLIDADQTFYAELPNKQDITIIIKN